MMKNLFFLMFIVLLPNFTSAQNQGSDFVENHYLEYFNLEPETIYTQLNKSKYLNSEELWFKTYVYNTKTQKPYLTTTNVYASIYDMNGKLIDKKLFYAEAGKTHGNFSLKDNYPPGVYFLKVATNWMKNFNDPNHSLQQFEIVGEMSNESVANIAEEKYDFQLLPEGGHLLSNTKNTIGFKITDHNGESITITSGRILDSKNNTLSNIKSNIFGIGKFNIFINENENYRVEATLENGSTIETDIPKPERTGLTMSVNNLNDNNVFISLTTNKSTLPIIVNEPYYMLIHRDGLLKKIDLRFEANKFDYTIAIPRKDLFSGMNILTVFNEKNQPILERLLFNKTESLIDHVTYIGSHSYTDSTQIRLASTKNKMINKEISISVLPASTESYNSKNTITAAFLLHPYLKGDVENPNYYFINNDRKTNYNLDLLLLTQGWSRYNWKHIFYNPQIPRFNFEKGFSIKGKINDENVSDIDEVIFFSPENKLLLSSKVTSSFFNFDNIFLKDSSNISLSAKTKKGKLMTSNLYYNIYPKYTEDTLDIKDLIKHKPKKILSNIDNFVYNDLITQLDTVSLTVEKIDERKEFMVNGGVNNEAIDLTTGYSLSTLVIDVIRSNGFDVINNGMEIQILSRRSPNFSGSLSPNVYVDNINTSDFLQSIQYLTVADIDALYIAKTGFGGNGAGGSINIFTKRGFSSKNKAKSNFKTSELAFGYATSKTYYTPLYNTSRQKTFSKFGVLHWIPILKPNLNGEFIFKIPNYTYDSINLYIEGLCEDGSIISTIETIDVN